MRVVQLPSIADLLDAAEIGPARNGKIEGEIDFRKGEMEERPKSQMPLTYEELRKRYRSAQVLLSVARKERDQARARIAELEFHLGSRQ